MKRLLLIAAVILVGLTASAQHLTFMGIPIDGNRGHFIRELMFKKNFKKSEYYSKDYPILQGKFAGENVLVLPLVYGKNKIYRVGVDFNETKSWYRLKTQFDNLVSKLTEKYGEPISVEKNNQEPYTDGSGKEIDGLYKGLVDWKAQFLCPNGYILVYFSVQASGCSVLISYTDSINEKKMSESALNDL